MRKKTTKKAKRIILTGMVPDSSARSYLHSRAQVELRFYKEATYGEDWCAVWKNGKQIWDCNAVYARTHFHKAN